MNLTIEVYLTLLSVILTSTSALIIYRQHRISPDRALLALSIGWLGFALWQTFNMIAYIFLNTRPFLIKNVFLIIAVLSTNIGLGLIDSGEIKKFSLAIWSFISSFAIASIFLPNPAEITTFESNGDATLAHSGFNRIIIFVLFFYVVLAYTFYAIKIYRNSPPKLKVNARLFLTGIIIYGFLGLFTYGSGISGIIPGITDLTISVGMLLSSLGLSRAPQLLYVLPFKAIRLSVIEKHSGVNFYTYSWFREFDGISEDLFSASLVALSAFMQEGVGYGNIQEVKLDFASLITYSPPDQPVFYIVLATSPSYTLRRGLSKFGKLFFENLGTYIKMGSTTNITPFQKAEDYILECFPYIPSDK